jgi:hypothetical protein
MAAMLKGQVAYPSTVPSDRAAQTEEPRMERKGRINSRRLLQMCKIITERKKTGDKDIGGTVSRDRKNGQN